MTQMTEESFMKSLLDFDKKYANEHEEPLEDIRMVQHIFTANDILEGDISVKENFYEEVKCKVRQTTNADRIRSMTDEELVEFILDIYGSYTPCRHCNIFYTKSDKHCRFMCEDGVLDWIKKDIK